MSEPMARVPTDNRQAARRRRLEHALLTEAHAPEKPVIVDLEVADLALYSHRAGKPWSESVNVSVAVPCSPVPVGHMVTAGLEPQKTSGVRRTG